MNSKEYEEDYGRQYSDVDPDRICCLNCRHFEERTCFCRRNPPTPMQIRIGEQLLTTSMYPKIAVPPYDYCGEFSPDEQEETSEEI